MFVLPMTRARGAEGGVTSHEAEAIRVVSMEAVAGDGLKGGGLQPTGPTI